MDFTEGFIKTTNIAALRAWLSVMQGATSRRISSDITIAAPNGHALIHLRIPTADVIPLTQLAGASGVSIEILAQAPYDATQGPMGMLALVYAALDANATARADYDAIRGAATQVIRTLDGDDVPIDVAVAPAFGGIA